MTLKERNERVENVRKMSEHFSLVSSQLQTNLNYAGLEKFINNNYKRIIENHGKR